MNAPAQLGPNGLQQKVSGRGDPSTDHDAIHRQHHHHVAHADAEVPSGIGQPLPRAAVTGAGRLDSLLGRGLAARGDDRVCSGECLEAAIVSAVAGGTVGQDGLVAELPGRPVMTEIEPARLYRA